MLNGYVQSEVLVRGQGGRRRAEGGNRTIGFPHPPSPVPLRHAFTLTELLVVITIIAILAGLITAAAVGAMAARNRTVILTEIGQLADAVERFKTETGGAYPPNIFRQGYLSSSTNPINERKTNVDNLRRFLTKARPTGTEFVTGAPAAQGTNNIDAILLKGIRPSEALVLWLSGFSADPKRPFSGTDLEATMIDDNGTTVNNVITYESFDAPLFEFDTTRLRFSREPKTDGGNRRFIEVYRADGTGPFQLQLYEYFPKGSEQPYVYFNTVDTPETVVRAWDTSEFFYENPNNREDNVCAIKRLKPNTPTSVTPTVANLEYVNQGKYQILHAGLDDAWGNFLNFGGPTTAPRANLVVNDTYVPTLLYPTGPFTGEVADTLTNFSGGTLESAQE